MEWNVYYHDTNKGTIDVINVFEHLGVERFVQKLFKDKKLTRESFAEELRHELMYHFWSRCEYEVLIKEWCGREAERKVDIYEQLMLNWDRFIDYCWYQRCA